MGSRSSARGGAGREHRTPAVGRRFAAAAARRPDPIPAFLARRVRLHAILPEERFIFDAPERREAPREERLDGLDVEDLLTGWFANAHGVRPPETLEDSADYARYLEDRDRAAHHAGELCRRLRERIAIWVAAQRATMPVA